ncbi:MAG: TraR/DksA family transcriptional regulator [Gammaproteobacteria bacterium]|nr:TraR/DksA family transcriptional regulator [Gammaproteobacteria bacterium]
MNLQLNDIRERLVTKLSELDRALELTSNHAQTVVLDQTAVGRVSRVEAMQDQQLGLAHQRQIAVDILLVKKALRKLETGEYGLCERCDDDIPTARLKLVPECECCVECLSEIE